MLCVMTIVLSRSAPWVFLRFWALFRNAPFPVVYALLVDSAPKAAGTALGIMIGVALGVSGLFASAVSGIVITHLGFNWHYVILAGICLLGFIPLARITETVRVARKDLPDAPAAA